MYGTARPVNCPLVQLILPFGAPRILVRDNGCGFDMKEAKRIFDPFQSLQN